MQFLRISPSRDGFTFAEILVTITIMAAVFPALLKVFNDVSRNQRLTDNRMTALYLMKFKMAEIEMNGFPETGESGGEFGEGSIFQWQSAVQDVQSEEFDGLRRIQLTIMWDHFGQPRSISTYSFIANRSLQQTQN
ncbi:hypothetical protein F4083_03105 [Candidatus Poribacteria bacterium]|nr:hypothetical protein [Candidatus Poribacteria bacterium]MYB66771.1 hypothetical protein [Candidatus Poribacteria bacterium]MYI93301.1 hypothetical protein [Candidatus Poribacteria bacterium]